MRYTHRWLLAGAVVLVTLYYMLTHAPHFFLPLVPACPPLDTTFAYFAALPYDLGRVVIIGDCDVSNVLQRHHTTSVRQIPLEQATSISNHVDTAFFLSIDPNHAQKNWRMVQRVKRMVSFIVVFSALEGHEDNLNDYIDFSDVLFLHEPASRVCDDGSFHLAIIAKGGHNHKSEPVVIEGIKSRTSATKRYFLTWTTDATTWTASPLRWLVIKQLFITVPDAEVFLFSNQLPTDFFSEYPRLHLIRYNEFQLFHHTPLQGWAENIDQWKKGKFYYSHFSDVFRVSVLWKYGGNYIDTDVLVLRELQTLRNSFGVEDILRSSEQTFWEWVRNTQPTLDKLYNVNLAVASFDQHSPFLSYVMHQLQSTYDPDVWNSAGPGLMQRCIAEWQRYHKHLVTLRPDPLSSSTTATLAMAGSVTLFTNPDVFYPVSWRDAFTATRRADFDPAILERIRQLPSYAYHVYTQMFKATNTTFSIEKGSLLDHIVHAS